MASKRKKQIITQPETQNTVMISKKRKIENDGDSEEISKSLSLPHDIIINDILTRVPVDSREIDDVDGVIKSNGIVFSYDAAAEKYKVVCFYKRKREFIFKIVTVDVKSGSWRNVVALPSPRLRDNYEAVFANGSLNWLTHDSYGMGGCKADQGKILCLDVSKEKFYTLDYPKGVSDENEGNQRKQYQHNEWLEYNIDVLQNNVVPKLFHDFESNNCVGLVKNPTLKIIFWNMISHIYDEPDERGFISRYSPEDYCYDVELKTFAFICDNIGTFVKWDLNSLVHFQSTFSDNVELLAL
ncbi:hypothetical protein MKW92_027038 [Papaver armeniacum]|nr:hypothetical protein MKW92_027038 [Papaver armeniacum]